jgi:hypothetical protein
VGIRCADHATPLSPQKLALTSPTIGGRLVGIVRSCTKATEYFFSIARSRLLMPKTGLVAGLLQYWESCVHSAFHKKCKAA